MQTRLGNRQDSLVGSTANAGNREKGTTAAITLGIGVPTYNRPEGLDRALASASNQSFGEFEICVSDNASTDPAVKEVLRHHSQRDSRIRVITQKVNAGPCANFLFVRAQARADYFIWLADDDLWDRRHLERLLARMTASTIMVFPDVTTVDAHGVETRNVLHEVYAHCVTRADYLRAWCGHGSGYPVYGLYNLKAMQAAGLLFELADDLDYYNEGIFLHKLFLHGGVRFAPETSLIYSTANKRPNQSRLVRSYFDYTQRMTLLYLENRKLTPDQKRELLGCLLDKHFGYIRSLCETPRHVSRKRTYARLNSLITKLARRA